MYIIFGLQSVALHLFQRLKQLRPGLVVSFSKQLIIVDTSFTKRNDTLYNELYK